MLYSRVLVYFWGCSCIIGPVGASLLRVYFSQIAQRVYTLVFFITPGVVPPQDAGENGLNTSWTPTTLRVQSPLLQTEIPVVLMLHSLRKMVHIKLRTNNWPEFFYTRWNAEPVLIAPEHVLAASSHHNIRPIPFFWQHYMHHNDNGKKSIN